MRAPAWKTLGDLAAEYDLGLVMTARGPDDTSTVVISRGPNVLATVTISTLIHGERDMVLRCTAAAAIEKLAIIFGRSRIPT